MFWEGFSVKNIPNRIPILGYNFFKKMYADGYLLANDGMENVAAIFTFISIL